MSDYERALRLWPAIAAAFAPRLAALPVLRAWRSIEIAQDQLAFRLGGPSYALTLSARVVATRGESALSVQTNLRCDSLLADRLSAELRVAECWKPEEHYRIGIFNIYVEWYAANTVVPPRFVPTCWSAGAPESEVEQWAQLLHPLQPIITSAASGTPLFPLLEAVALQPARIPGSRPTWAGEFDRAIAMLDVRSPSEVAGYIQARLKERLSETDADVVHSVLRSVACELSRLQAWLLGTKLQGSANEA